MRYHIESRIYRPRLSPWRIVLGLILICLTALQLSYTLTQINEDKFISSCAATLFFTLLALIFHIRLFKPYFSHRAENGMAALVTFFTPATINREIATLDFLEIVNNSGIHLAGHWLVLQSPGTDYFVVLPLGMIRFASVQKLLRNDEADDRGESYYDYTFHFYLTNGQSARYQLPLEYHGKKAHRSEVHSQAVEEKFAAVETILQHLLGERLLDSPDDDWLFLYRKKRSMLESAFEFHRKSRTDREIFSSFVEFFPIDTMHIAEERHHALPSNKAIRHVKVAAWLILLLGWILLSRIPAPDDLPSEQRTLVFLVCSAAVLLSTAMLGIYSYEIVRTLLARRRARKQEREEAAWLKGMDDWHVWRENSLVLKLLNLIFWTWMILEYLSRLAAL